MSSLPNHLPWVPSPGCTAGRHLALCQAVATPQHPQCPLQQPQRPPLHAPPRSRQYRCCCCCCWQCHPPQGRCHWRQQCRWLQLLPPLPRCLPAAAGAPARSSASWPRLHHSGHRSPAAARCDPPWLRHCGRVAERRQVGRWRASGAAATAAQVPRRCGRESSDWFAPVQVAAIKLAVPPVQRAKKRRPAAELTLRRSTRAARCQSPPGRTRRARSEPAPPPSRLLQPVSDSSPLCGQQGAAWRCGASDDAIR